MKYLGGGIILRGGESLPARGVWIEIVTAGKVQAGAMSLPARGVWIEIGVRGRE